MFSTESGHRNRHAIPGDSQVSVGVERFELASGLIRGLDSDLLETFAEKSVIPTEVRFRSKIHGDVVALVDFHRWRSLSF